MDFSGSWFVIYKLHRAAGGKNTLRSQKTLELFMTLKSQYIILGDDVVEVIPMLSISAVRFMMASNGATLGANPRMVRCCSEAKMSAAVRGASGSARMGVKNTGLAMNTAATKNIPANRVSSSKIGHLRLEKQLISLIVNSV